MERLFYRVVKVLNVDSIPKAEIHLHLEGAAPPDLVAALAAKKGLDLKGLVREGRYVWRGFSEFLAAYDAAAAVFTTPDDYEALARQVLEGLAAQNTLYAEFFVSPDHAEATGVSWPDYMAAVIRAIEGAERSHGITARLIPLCVRGYGPQNARRVADLVVRNPHPYVTGFGMAGDERMHHPRDFAPAFAAAAEGGLRLTAHAGEFGGPESVAAALDHLKIERVGHGVRASEDPALMRRLAEERIVLEVCPISNVVLEVYPTLAAHPFKTLRDAGVRVTISTDDPPFFGTTIARDYRETAETFGLSAEDLRGVTRTALEAAFCDAPTRARLLKRLDAPLQAP